MTVTRKQRLEHARAAQEQGEAPPDRSVQVAELADGWTVNHLATAGDLRREGLLMRHCLAKYAGDELVLDRPGTAIRSDLPDDAPIGPCDVDLMRSCELTGRFLDMSLYSLRDPMNLPHATFWAEVGVHAASIKGFRNSVIKAVYMDRIRPWLEQTETLHFADDRDSYYRIMDGRMTIIGVRAGAERWDLQSMAEPCEEWETSPAVSASRRKALHDLEEWGAYLLCDIWHLADIHRCNLIKQEENHELLTMPDVTDDIRARVTRSRRDFARKQAGVEVHIKAKRREMRRLAAAASARGIERFAQRRRSGGQRSAVGRA